MEAVSGEDAVWLFEAGVVVAVGFFIAFLLNRIVVLKWHLWRTITLANEVRSRNAAVFSAEERKTLTDAHDVFRKWP